MATFFILGDILIAIYFSFDLVYERENSIRDGIASKDPSLMLGVQGKFPELVYPKIMLYKLMAYNSTLGIEVPIQTYSAILALSTTGDKLTLLIKHFPDLYHWLDNGGFTEIRIYQDFSYSTGGIINTDLLVTYTDILVRGSIGSTSETYTLTSDTASYNTIPRVIALHTVFAKGYANSKRTISGLFGSTPLPTYICREQDSKEWLISSVTITITPTNTTIEAEE